MTTLEAYYDLSKDIFHADTRHLRRTVDLLFDGVPLQGRSLLDVGGGSGLMSYYAASRGAHPVVCLEPSEAGSNPRMDAEFDRWQTGLEPQVSVELVRKTIQDLDPAGRQYDVVFISSAINHIDEEACARLPHDSEARRRYSELFAKLAALTTTGGDLVIADAARKNLWGALGRRSPFAPSIEWSIHAQPSTWAELAETAGFEGPRITWRANKKLGAVGQKVLGNALGGWATNSMFVLHMRKSG